VTAVTRHRTVRGVSSGPPVISLHPQERVELGGGAPDRRGGAMQALQLTEWQHEPELREVDPPEPGPGEVLVRVVAAGACHSDLHLMHDFPAGLLPYDLPFTLGHENAGVVEAMGAGVTGLDVGQPVAVYGPWGCGRCLACVQGAENYCERQAEIGASGGGLGRDGGMAPLMVVPAGRYLVPLGDLDPVEAAPLTDAGLTPYHAIRRALPVLPAGSSAVVIGAGGGLGHLAVQILRAVSSAQVIAVDGRPAGLELADRLGAHATVAAGDDAADRIRELTGGRNADAVFDFVGVDATMALGASVVRPRGHLTIVGIGGGSLSVGFFTIPYEVTLSTTYWGTIPELHELIALAARGDISPVVQRYGLADATDAYQAMRDGTLEGRAVVVHEA
jgi:alcohol dehydrogenase, propanol-preferring